MCILTDDMDALYENSKPFSRFLKKKGLDEIRKAKLQLRENIPLFLMCVNFLTYNKLLLIFITRERLGVF